MKSLEGSFALDMPTYSCPCEKHSSVKSKPVTFSDCPCALLIVIANANLTGNGNRLKANGKSVGISGILGIRTSSPSNGPVKKVALMTYFCNCFTTSRVPLHSLGGSMLRCNIMGQPTFSTNVCWVMPLRFCEFKNYWIVGCFFVI